MQPLSNPEEYYPSNGSQLLNNRNEFYKDVSQSHNFDQSSNIDNNLYNHLHQLNNHDNKSYYRNYELDNYHRQINSIGTNQLNNNRSYQANNTSSYQINTNCNNQVNNIPNHQLNNNTSYQSINNPNNQLNYRDLPLNISKNHSEIQPQDLRIAQIKGREKETGESFINKYMLSGVRQILGWIKPSYNRIVEENYQANSTDRAKNLQSGNTIFLDKEKKNVDITPINTTNKLYITSPVDNFVYYAENLAKGTILPNQIHPLPDEYKNGIIYLS